MSSNPQSLTYVYAAPRSSDERQDLDTVSGVEPESYYVIVGRGIAAWYNHASLICTEYGRKRLGGRKILHIGFKEDWSRRAKERMGQWPRMLDFFVEFQRAFDSADLGFGEGISSKRDWLDSDVFAAQLEKLEEVVQQKHADGWTGPNSNADPLNESLILDGFVGIIEDRDTFDSELPIDKYLPDSEVVRRRYSKWQDLPDLEGPGYRWMNDSAKYRLSVFRWVKEEGKYDIKFVYADKVDICSGLGQPRFFGREVTWGSKTLQEQYTPNYFLPPTQTDTRTQDKLIVSGNDFIGVKNDPEKTVLIFKGNAVGAQSVQSAVGKPDNLPAAKKVWWVTNKIFADYGAIDANVPGGRNILEIVGATPFNDLQDQEQQELSDNLPQYVEDSERQKYFPPEFYHRVEYHDIKKISESGGKVEVEFEPGLIDRRNGTRATAKQSGESVQKMLQEAGGTPTNIPAHFAGQLTLQDKDAYKILQKVTADQLVFSLGQELSDRTDGTPAYMIKLLKMGWKIMFGGFSRFPDGITNNDEDKDVGQDGCIRILGSAALLPPGLTKDDGSTYKAELLKHGDNLPNEAPAAGAGGLNPSLNAIRRANKWNELMDAWDTARLYKAKLNTASSEELIKICGLAENTADWIVGVRAVTDRGYDVAGIKERLKIVQASDKKPRVETPELDKITTEHFTF